MYCTCIHGFGSSTTEVVAPINSFHFTFNVLTKLTNINKYKKIVLFNRLAEERT